MNVLKPMAILFIFFFFNEVTSVETESTIGKRATTPLEIEVLTVADYSAFNKWYELLDPSIPDAKRIEIAKQNLTTWLGTMIHTANIVYKRLEAHGLFISIKLVDLHIMTTEADSPWTETTKYKVNDTYFIDSHLVHPLFEVKSIELQKTIPHDHAMLFTMYSSLIYTMLHGKNGTVKFAGNAYLGAECRPNSQSIVEDSEEMYTALTIAHELGHSLSCEHDGTNNTCKVGMGYCMEANYVKYNKNKWIFSSCSINYIRTFVDRMNSRQRNCMAKVNDNHPKPALALATQKWVGELYSVDEQCVIAQGKGSYMCRGVYARNFTEFCLSMWCYNKKKDVCYTADGGDGTQCGSGSWCLSNNCVKDDRAPSSYDPHCPYGDADGVVHKQLTCKQIAATNPNECLRQSVKQMCCISCKNVQTTAVPADTQCKEEIGPGSYMCRSGQRYTKLGYEILCENLYCFNTSTNDSCSSIDAMDKTPCAHKKWCLDGKCVQDTNAPEVPDNCPAGDLSNDPTVSFNNMTCEQIKQHDNNWVCYKNYTKRQCCKTCADVRRNSTDCEFGDKNKTCFSLIASDPSNCYGRNAHICCESCSKLYKPKTGCEYGDKDNTCFPYITSDPSNCYGKNANICCESCSKFYKPQTGCEYGDKDVSGCAGLIKSRSDSHNCYGQNADVCCRTCAQYYNASNTGCEYGDKNKDCATLVTSSADSYNCYGRNADICCGSCSKYYNPAHKGCEYGDKFRGCEASKCSGYTDESRINCCQTCKASVIVG